MGHLCGTVNQPRNYSLQPGSVLALKADNTEVIRLKRRFDDMYEIVGEQPLGKGAFGQVFKCKEKNDEYALERAVQILEKRSMNKLQLQWVHNEIKIMMKLSKNNGVMNTMRYFHTFEDESKIYIVKELYEERMIDLNLVWTNQSLTEAEIAKIVYQILLGLKQLHKKGICHRDITPYNIKISANCDQVKIDNFGIATEIQDGKNLTQTCGMPKYMAPEVTQNSYDHKVDLWSLGVLVYNLISGESPFGLDNVSVQDQIRRFETNNHELGELRFEGENWANTSENAKDFIRKLLVIDPSERQSAQQAIMHSWFAKHKPWRQGFYTTLVSPNQ